MSKTTANDLSKLIGSLQAERQAAVDKIAEIDSIFAQSGIDAPANGAKKKRGPKPGSKRKKTAKKPGPKLGAKKKSKGKKKKSRRGPGTYKQTADDFVLAQLKGGPVTTKEINAAWKKAGRGGTADNTLSKLAKAGTIKRSSIEGKRGSKYSL